MGRNLALTIGGLITLEAGGIVRTGPFPPLGTTPVSTFRERTPSSAVHVIKARLKHKLANRQYRLVGRTCLLGAARNAPFSVCDSR